ncbi:unnamed protein product [Musa acuminata subsp. malaccensis]|uniref:(wild Malaysian banana) hypothetical protein n=1 Tax=Musa acuminata subsp. malaccensis TaxID=214687 RepID=A0A8D7AXT8_MUSAM|nr:unnamed protein product [Musa acuminata subsp. malaccensis]
MNGSCSDELERCEPEEAGIASDANDRSLRSGGSGDDAKPVRSLAPSSSSAPSPKRSSRRAVEKRVVTVPISDAKGTGEGAPPADSWAWRKYGQKPIKGSPYPRGYYRCSSSKGCPARKQVERSRVDPDAIVVTYSFDHNHPWPLPKNHHHKHAAAAMQQTVEDQPPPQNQSSPPESAERDEKFSDLIAEEEPALLVDAPGGGFQWFADVCSTPSTSPSAAGSCELLYGSVFFAGDQAAAALPEEQEAGGRVVEEEDSLFAGLGELPEYSVVLRRGLASASWVGTTG